MKGPLVTVDGLKVSRRDSVPAHEEVSSREHAVRVWRGSARGTEEKKSDTRAKSLQSNFQLWHSQNSETCAQCTRGRGAVAPLPFPHGAPREPRA